MAATISVQLICLISLSLQLIASLPTNDFNSLMNEFPLDCLLRDFTFNVTLADDKDRKCSGLITVKTCYGYCETMEVDGPDGDDRIVTSKVCSPSGSVPMKYKLRDCDRGMSTKSKIYTYHQPTGCNCSSCNPRTTNCKALNHNDLSGEFGQYRSQPQAESVDPRTNNIVRRRRNR